jgi:HEAT repeat protein
MAIWVDMTTYRQLTDIEARIRSNARLTPDEIEIVRTAAYSNEAASWKALRLLEYLATERHIKPLTRLVNNSNLDPSIRYKALRILCRYLGQAAAFEELLIAGFKGEGQGILTRLEALHLARELIGQQRSPRAVDVLVQILQDEEAHWTERQAAYGATLKAAGVSDAEIGRFDTLLDFDPHLIDQEMIMRARRNQRPH